MDTAKLASLLTDPNYQDSNGNWKYNNATFEDGETFSFPFPSRVQRLGFFGNAQELYDGTSWKAISAISDSGSGSTLSDYFGFFLKANQ